MLSDLLMRLRALFRRNAVENDLNDEVRFHFDQQVEKLVGEYHLAGPRFRVTDVIVGRRAVPLPLGHDLGL